MATPSAALAATRDDKLARFTLAFVYLPAILMWLREQSLASDESQQVGIDGIGLRGRHAVRKALVGFQGAVLQ
jgi:hypothetical protein